MAFHMVHELGDRFYPAKVLSQGFHLNCQTKHVTLKAKKANEPTNSDEHLPHDIGADQKGAKSNYNKPHP